MDITENPDEALKREFKKGKKLLSLERVRLALERLQLAWLRGALTFVALGFTAYRYYLSRIEDGKDSLAKFVNGRDIGLFLIFVGFLGLLQATLQHRRNMDMLKKYYPELPYSISLIQSYFVLAFTLLLFIEALIA